MLGTVLSIHEAQLARLGNEKMHLREVEVIMAGVIQYLYIEDFGWAFYKDREYAFIYQNITYQGAGVYLICTVA